MSWQDYRPTEASSRVELWPPPATSSWSRPHSSGPPSRHFGAQGQEDGHIPCLLNETVEAMLNPDRKRLDGTYDGVYVDCTFGRGGHSREILKRLSPDGQLFAFDVDPEAVAVARTLEAADSRFRIVHRPFGDIDEVFPEACCLDGVMVDLGVSSPQLDDHHRGFHISYSGEPDMRMNQSSGVKIMDWLRNVTAEELAWVIYHYGEDDDRLQSERIAEHIIAELRQLREGDVLSNRRLAQIVKSAKGAFQDNVHPAKLTFQALRVFLNQEMQQLEKLLHGAMKKLKIGASLAIITFKKKEANVVRAFVREHEQPDPLLAPLRLSDDRLCELYPLLCTDTPFAVEQLGTAMKSSMKEVAENWRSRSSAVHSLVKRGRHERARKLRANTRPPEERFMEPLFRPEFVGGTERTVVDLHNPRLAGDGLQQPPAPRRDDLSAPSLPTGMAAAPPPPACTAASATTGEAAYPEDLIPPPLPPPVAPPPPSSRPPVVATPVEPQSSSPSACSVPAAACGMPFQVAAYPPAGLYGHDAAPQPESRQPPAVAAQSASGPYHHVAAPQQESRPPPTAAAPSPAVPSSHTHTATPHQDARHFPEAAAQTPAVGLGHADTKETGHVIEVWVRAAEDYNVGVVSYLPLRRGDLLKMLYLGKGGDEEGWAYGMNEQDQFGWFPTKAVEQVHPDQAG